MENILKIEEVPQPHIPVEKELEEIFRLQKELIEPYIGIEGLPQYPIDVHTKENQTLIKDFISRVVEELGEAFESTLKLYDYWDLNNLTVEKVKPELINFNMECSDALHFMVETLIYLNIEPDSIRDYAHQILSENNLNSASGYGTLNTLLKIARHKNNMVGVIPYPNQRGYDLSFIVETSKDLFTKGGNKISNYQIEMSKALLWEITYWLQVARNCMKNKAWKQTEEATEESKMQLYMMEAFLSMIRYFDFLGMTSESIYTIYYKKNRVNFSRIKNKY